MTEAEIQKAVFANLRARAMPNTAFWHVPNDQSSRRKPGYLAGVSDVHILHCGKFYAMELKKDGGRASEDQLAFVSSVNAAGGYAWVSEGHDQSIKSLELMGILRGTA